MGIFSSIFSFRKNERVPSLGMGVANLGFERPRNVSTDSIYSPHIMVRNQLVTQAPGAVKIGQRVVPVALNGNGGGLQGQLLLGPLARETEG